MRLRYPGTREIDGHLWKDLERGVSPRHSFFGLNRTHREYTTDWTRDLVYVAPRWIAWLYRWLPTWLSWQGRCWDTVRPPAVYLWVCQSTRWLVAWLPARRELRYGARLGILVLNSRRIVL